MEGKIKIGIIICDRYKTCAGGKCFKAMKNKDGAFNIYKGSCELELVGFTTCGGCPGGNIELAPQEMIKNGAEVIHLATGFVVGYPPCPYINEFNNYIREKYGVNVVIGTHPIPQKYCLIHRSLGTWNSSKWEKIVRPTLTDEQTRLEYD